MKGIILFSLAALLFLQDPRPPTISEQHYRIYRGDGSLATLDQLVAELESMRARVLENRSGPQTPTAPTAPALSGTTSTGQSWSVEGP